MISRIKRIVQLSVVSLALTLLVPAAIVSAQSPAPTISISAKDLNLEDGATTLKGGDVAQVLMYVYIVAGMVAVIVIVIGGIRYATSAGDSGSVQTAKNTIQYAVVGLVVIIMAAAITDFVIKNVAN